MMDSDLSPQDKKDLDKFIKFFALKVLSLIMHNIATIRLSSTFYSIPELINSLRLIIS